MAALLHVSRLFPVSTSNQRDVMSVSSCVSFCLAASSAAILFADDGLAIPNDPQWEPIVDEVYLQEIPQLIPLDRRLNAVAVHDGTIRVVGGTGQEPAVRHDALLMSPHGHGS